MKLTKIKICNYRSFGEEQVINIDDLTTIIGHNSAGKTAALCALKTIFSENNNDRVLQRSDFHLPKGKNPDDIDKLELYIEAVFSYAEMLDEDYESTNAAAIFDQYTVDVENGIPYLRIRLEATWERSSNIEGSIDSSIKYITCPENESIKDENRHLAKRVELDYIRVIYVPAVREPSKQLKNVSGTMMHRVLNSVVWSNTTKSNIENAIEHINDQFVSEKGVSIVNDSIYNQWKKYDSDERYSDAKLRFNSTDIESSIKNSEVYFSPTVTPKEYTIDEMGDGLRSLFYISMVNSILDVETEITNEIREGKDDRAFSQIPPELTIIAIEEPENHIAPQLLGKIIGNLRAISERKNAQVILTSHSPAIVKRVDPENLRYLRINDDQMNSVVRRIILPDKESLESQYKFVKEAVRAYPEIFFSKLVVLGEGESEEIILTRYLEAHLGSIDVNGISVVPLGGRYVNHFWRLLSGLNIPYVTLLDFDREREGGGWGRIKYAIKQLELISISKDDLFSLPDGSVIKDSDVETMHTYSVNRIDDMNQYIEHLEKFNVFYSSPLDIDFLMLEQMKDKYIESLEKTEGPRIEVVDATGQKSRIHIKGLDKTLYIAEYGKRIKDDIHQTLKSEGGDGTTYNQTQKELMIWYSYFFLSKGKPTTHIMVFSNLSSEDLIANTPSVIGKIIDKVKAFLHK